MKKISILLIIALSIVGAVLIYRHFDNDKLNNQNVIKIHNDYNLVENSIINTKNIDEINSIFNNKSGIIFLCIKENEWCNYYASYLNQIANEYNIDEIMYLDIKQDRQYNTSGYRKLINHLENYLLKDDENNLKIFVPTSIIVKNGNIIGYDNETSIMLENTDPNTYWTDEKVNQFKEKITNFIIKYKEEI